LNQSEHKGVDKTPSSFRCEAQELTNEEKKDLPRINVRDKLEKKFPLPDNVTHDLDDIAKAFRDG
jgi:hypothetical protein